MSPASTSPAPPVPSTSPHAPNPSSTPPPPGRVRTPPTPLHGSKHDCHVPYSPPRRSSRINNKSQVRDDDDNNNNINNNKHPSPAHATRRSKKASFLRTSSQTFSPPSSPGSPAKMVEVDPDEYEAALQRLGGPGTGSAHLDQKSAVASTTHHMLPTPVKTPRKRGYLAEKQLNSARRALFQPSRSRGEFDDIMPSPQKTRRAKKDLASTLESFGEDDPTADSVQVYTDSHERVPDPKDGDEADEDNPFVVAKTRAGTKKAKYFDGQSEQIVDPGDLGKTGMGPEIDRAVGDNDGLVYVFRGKKLFRRFSEKGSRQPSNGSNQDHGPALVDDPSQTEIRRQAGGAASRHFTRSTIKPRRLFPPAQEHSSPATNTDDEEAVTDIEVQTSGHVHGKGKMVELHRHVEEKKGPEPVHEGGTPCTPTVSVEEPTHEPSYAKRVSRSSTPRAKRSAKAKRSLFDQWRRTKPSNPPSMIPSKRAGGPLEKDDINDEETEHAEAVEGLGSVNEAGYGNSGESMQE